MQYFKISAAGKIAEAAHELSADVCLTPEDILTMLEYPPDSSMGDIAFPCFRLSKTLRNAPPKIAASLAEKIGDFGIGQAVAVGAYLNFKYRRIISLTMFSPKSKKRAKNTARQTKERERQSFLTIPPPTSASLSISVISALLSSVIL